MCVCVCVYVLICDKGFSWNSSSCDFECDKSCDIGEYLDYENYKCIKKVVDKLVFQCTESIHEIRLAKITLAEYENECKSSCTLYIVLLSIIFTINIGIATYLVYYKYMNNGKQQLLKKVLYFKQHFTKHIKMVKDINIKHRSCYDLSDMTGPKDVREKIGHITIKQFDDYNKISSVNPLYLMFDSAT